MAQTRRRSTTKKVEKPRKKIDFSQIPPYVLRMGTFIALLMIFVGGSLGITAFLNNPENLPISQIDIQGEFKFIKDVELRAVVEKYTKTNLYLLDADALEADLETQPWIRKVSLRKKWPSQLTINIEEQRPLAFWGKDRLMNQYGELFVAQLPEMKGVIPMLYSPETKGRDMAERYKQILAWLPTLPMQVSELTEDESGAWRFKLKDGPEVLVGNEDQERRIERFRTGIQQELANKLGSIRRVDLRYPNGFAVEWKQPSLNSGNELDTGHRS